MTRGLARISELPRSAKHALTALADASAATLAVALMRAAMPSEAELPVALEAPVPAVLTVLCFTVLGCYRHALNAMSRRVVLDLALGSVLLTALMVAGEATLSGSFAPVMPVVLIALVTFLIAAGVRALWVELRGYADRGRCERQRVAIWGAGTAGMQLAAMLEQSRAWQLAAFIDDDPTKRAISIRGCRVHTPDELARLRADGISRVIIAIPSANPAQRKRLIQQITKAGMRAQSVPELESIMLGRNLSALEDVSVEQILERKVVTPMRGLLSAHNEGRSVLVTGAGGSIGSEIARQIARLKPRRLVLLDNSEYALYRIVTELSDGLGDGLVPVEVVPVLGSVCDHALLERVIEEQAVEILYHAAAYKHVPLVELNPVPGIANNTLGTWVAAQAAGAAGVRRFVLVSTDKAVRPTSVMGASKRLAERAVEAAQRLHPETIFTAVRFGNVLESSGSVLPRFRDQIHRGGPITVTHPEVTRYFMTIGEAAQLVMQAAALARGGEVFALDMGSSVKVLDLARRLLELSGLSERSEANPDGEIEIVFTGLRPGEKLFEELLIGDAPQPTAHPKIFSAQDNAGFSVCFEECAPLLEQLVAERDADGLRALCARFVEGYTPDLAVAGTQDRDPVPQQVSAVG